MRRATAVLSAAVLTAGCGAGARGGSATGPSEPPSSSSVDRAAARLSVHTHHGADALSGLTLSGRCSGGRVKLLVGHGPAFDPLRRTGIEQIDRTRPPRKATLLAPCRSGAFTVRGRQLVVRWGAGPLRARAAGQATGVEVVVAGRGIE